MVELNKIYHADCLEFMKEIPDSFIDMVLCDLPYGVTQNKKDKQLDLHKLWDCYKRIVKQDGAIILTSQFPYTIDLIQSNKSWFKYDLIWDKVLTSGFLNANRMPLRVHEHILVFYNKLPYYSPQKTVGKKNHSKGKEKKNRNRNYGEFGFVDNKDKLGNLKHPTSIIQISKPHPSVALHRTEKPVELAEWLIKSFSKRGDVILDNCIGSGWTAVASIRHQRRFIGIDMDKEFVDISRQRIKEVNLCLPLEEKQEGGNGIPPTSKDMGILETFL